MANEICRTILYRTKWLNLVNAEITRKGHSYKWTYCTRTNDEAKNRTNAVVIVPFIQEGDDTKIILTREYRVPIDAIELGFPSGLIDAGETPFQAAGRELFEETGYGIIECIQEPSPMLYTSAGLTDETFCYVFAKAECKGEATPEASEDIEILKLNINELTELLHQDIRMSGRAWPLLNQYIINKKFPI